jgi:pimeloyl-ACP methyl ester carboxylesterase
VVGTSLGSFVGGLLAAAEPKVRTACLLLGGGGLVDAFSEHPLAAPLVAGFKAVGLGLDPIRRQIAPVDPLTYAAHLKTKQLFLVAASRDDVVPPNAMRALWKATGEPPILWLDSTHVGAVAHMPTAMKQVLEHLSR